MAKKINVKLILELRDAHMSRNGIASTRHMSRHSVSDVFHIADEKGITYRDVRFLDENEVYRMFYPDKHAVDDLYKDPDYEYIHQELRKTGVLLNFYGRSIRTNVWKMIQSLWDTQNFAKVMVIM